MLHVKRVWCVQEWSGALEDLAEALTERTWTCCAAFRWQGLLLVNDATSENGAQEYAVLDEKTREQIESLTCSWMTPGRLARVLRELSAGREHEGLALRDFDPAKQLQTPARLGRCHHCR